jgi:N-acetylglucosaminyldiphosphoundecaprenol N-acetyl-beta-D-mannosaminyltransferase
MTKKQNIVGVGVHLTTYEEVVRMIQAWKDEGRREYVVVVNPHSVMMCHRDRDMGWATRNAALTLPDGVGITLAARMLGYQHCGRVTGPALMLRLCECGRRYQLRHYFYGAAEGVSECLAERLCGAYPGLQVAGTCAPPFRPPTREEDEQIVRLINSAHPDIVWVGLGAPLQEKWMAEHVGRISAAALIGVGAAFDFHSGHVKWAPHWIRTAGLEWAFRLAGHPGRLWRRNVDSPLFLISVTWQLLTGVPGLMQVERPTPKERAVRG